MNKFKSNCVINLGWSIDVVEESVGDAPKLPKIRFERILFVDDIPATTNSEMLEYQLDNIGRSVENTIYGAVDNAYNYITGSGSNEKENGNFNNEKKDTKVLNEKGDSFNEKGATHQSFTEKVQLDMNRDTVPMTKSAQTPSKWKIGNGGINLG